MRYILFACAVSIHLFFTTIFCMLHHRAHVVEQKLLEGPEECSICLDDLNQRKLTTILCKHTFHEDCLLDWSRCEKTCPLCRKEFVIVNPIYKKESTAAQQTESIWKQFLSVFSCINRAHQD